MSAVESTARTEREKALETARGLKAKADHASTPAHEAATCQKMLDSLVRKWSFTEAELETHTEDDDWRESWEDRQRARAEEAKKAKPEERVWTFEEEWDIWAREFHRIGGQPRLRDARYPLDIWYGSVRSDLMSAVDMTDFDDLEKTHLRTLAERCLDIAIEEFRVAKKIPDPVHLKNVAKERFLKLKEVDDLQKGKKFIGLDGQVKELAKLSDLELASMLHSYASELRMLHSLDREKVEKFGKEESFRRFLAGVIAENTKPSQKWEPLQLAYRMLHEELRRRELRVTG